MASVPALQMITDSVIVNEFVFIEAADTRETFDFCITGLAATR